MSTLNQSNVNKAKGLGRGCSADGPTWQLRAFIGGCPYPCSGVTRRANVQFDPGDLEALADPFTQTPVILLNNTFVPYLSHLRTCGPGRD